MVAFAQASLSGLSISNPSSLQFGPDGRLYISQDNGVVVAVTVTQDSSGGYVAAAKETISLVRFIPNHNDDGTYNPTINTRQVTGILVAGTADNPVIYVSSSDPRIGGGTNKGDTGLDTNSGTLSRLTKDATGAWTKVDLVYGLPRSEENHAVNGMQINPENGHILLTVGGQTNAGAPSQEFGYLSDYAYGASIVDIDVAAIDALPSKTYLGQTYKYVLPTVDDPTRSAPGDVVATGQPEVFGGNNGLNQARLTPDSPVQLYATGFRNLYDIAVNANGQIYGIDNGGNPGWGGPPQYIQPDGSLGATPTPYPTNMVNDGSGSINKAPLHLIEEGYYGGHPTPITANPSGAGLYAPDGSPLALPSDWPPVPASMINPVSGYYLPPGSNRADLLPADLHTPLNLRGDIAAFSGSVNGIDDYRATAFDGEMQGDLVAASLNDDSIYRIDLAADGKTVLGVSNLTPGGLVGGGNALDVHAAPETGPFAGTIWVASYGGGITILTPSNGETSGNSNDTDNDGLNNFIDPFAVDATNGQSVVLTGGSTLSWTFSQNEPHPGPSGLGNLGFTGIMTNGTQSYLDQYDANKTIMGGAAAGVLVQDITDGTPLGNNQRDAYQFGIDIGSDVGSYTISTKVNNPFDLAVPTDNQSVGFYIGTGDQSNYVRLVAGSATVEGVANSPVIDFIFESGDEIISHQTMLAPIFGGSEHAVTASDSIVLDLTVDPVAGTVTPSWTITRGSGPGVPGTIVTGQGTTIVATDDMLAALRGNYVVNSFANGPLPSGLAVGIIGTSDGPGDPFSATWNNITITSTPKPDGDVGAAELHFTPNADIDVSTYQPNTVQISNLITSSKDLKKVIINIEDAILPDGAFFDPNAAGGNNGKAFQINSAVGSFAANATYQLGSAATGYKQISIDFNGFNPGETVNFSLDIDPMSMLGYGKTVPAGGVSGAELAGSRVTFVFDDGSTTEAELFGSGIAQADARGVSNLRAAPTLSLQGQSSGNVSFPAGDPSVIVHGTPGATVRVQMMTVAQLSVPFEDPYEGNAATDVVYETVTLDGAGEGVISGSLSVDQVLVMAVAEVNAQGIAISAVSEPLRIIQQTGPLASIIGTDAGETLEGTPGDDGMEGKGGDDILIGLDGDDLLNGGTGADQMAGGQGDDYYLVDSAGDQVIEAANAGLDTVRTVTGTYVLGTNVENLIYTGTGNFNGTGNSLANLMIGSRGADRLDGLAGADMLRGGAGNDTYVVDNSADSVIELANQGTDRVLSQVSFVLSDYIETLQLTTSKALNGSGNAIGNTLIGNAGINILDGRGGSDILTGGAGNDVFQFQRGEASGDKVTDFAGAGVAGGDTLKFVGYGADASLTQVGTTDSYIIHAGAAFNNAEETIQIVGVTHLTAGDYMFAPPPNFAPTDMSLSNQTIAENGAANDVIGTISVADPDAGETFTYTLLNDAQGRFVLSGGALLATGAFDYEAGSSYTIVIGVTDSGGSELQRAFAIDITDLNDNAPVFVSPQDYLVDESELVVGDILATDADQSGTAITLSIKPDSGDGSYFQLNGANTLAFIAPPDFESTHGNVYTLTIVAFDGLNASEQAISVTVSDIDESSPNSAPTSLTLTAQSVAENSLSGTIVGTLSAVDPDDGDSQTYSLLNDAGGRFGIVDNQLVVIGALDFENAAAHTVTVRVRDSVGHSLQRNFVIDVTDVKAADTMGLSAADDHFTYNSALTFDRIDGMSGMDSLDVVAPSVSIGTDGAAFTIDLSNDNLAEFSAVNVEYLNVAGSSVTVTADLSGTALGLGEVTINGTAEADSLNGALAGAALKLSGGAGADQLTGGSAADVLDGGTGDDSMTGGAGDDLYFVDSSGDTVFEGSAGGTDTVSTTLASFTLASNFDNLIYTGTKAFTGTGNATDNVLTGSSGADRLDGLGGLDVMRGGLGSDTYIVESSGDVVVELADQGIDRVLSQTSYTLSDNVENLQLTTSKAINGTGNALANVIQGNAGINLLDGRGGMDTLTGGAGNDIFEFQRGEATGDKVTDFTGAGVVGGDVLKLSGYGTDAFFTQTGGSDFYEIHAGAAYGGLVETIQLVGVTTLGLQDVIFA
tara:strand:- start:31332 stop:37586 length:6255 start_codon:yes stop_codon:yes gene_type:complete